MYETIWTVGVLYVFFLLVDNYKKAPIIIKAYLHFMYIQVNVFGKTRTSHYTGIPCIYFIVKNC